MHAGSHCSLCNCSFHLAVAMACWIIPLLSMVTTCKRSVYAAVFVVNVADNRVEVVFFPRKTLYVSRAAYRNCRKVIASDVNFQNFISRYENIKSETLLDRNLHWQWH